MQAVAPGFGSIQSPSDLIICRTLAKGSLAAVKLVATKGQRRKYYSLKTMRKEDIIHRQLVEQIKNEKLALQRCRHPFIIKLYHTFNDQDKVYMLMEYLPGGELFTFVRKHSCLPNDAALFYATEIFLALAHIQNQGFAYRDLKPENVLLSKKGHIKLVDLGFAKELREGERSFTFCGSLNYLAPEIITGTGHNKLADWWAYGVLLYEILVGLPPFYDENPKELYAKIIAGRFTFPKHVQAEAQDLIEVLLTVNMEERYGNNLDDVMNHPWFDGVDFDMVLRKEIIPPWVPSLKQQGDSTYYQQILEEEEDLSPARLHDDPFSDF